MELRRKIMGSFGVVIAMLALLSSAIAETPPATHPPLPPEHLHSIWLEMGLGAPSGGYGVHYQLNLPIVSPGVHAGRGFSGEHVGAALTFKPWDPTYDDGLIPSWSETFLELSYSAAFQSEATHSFPDGLYHWFHVGAGIGSRVDFFSITLTGGAMVLLDGPDGAHADIADASLFNFDGFTPVPWFRFGVGVGF